MSSLSSFGRTECVIRPQCTGELRRTPLICVGERSRKLPSFAVVFQWQQHSPTELGTSD